MAKTRSTPVSATKIKGQNVAAPIVPFTNLEIYPTHIALYGKGGHKTVATIYDRDALPIERLEEGCSVFVKENGVKYICHINESNVISWEVAKEDQAFQGDLPLVVPIWVTKSYTHMKNDNTVITTGSLSANSLDVEKGSKVSLTLSWKWTAASGKKSPTSMTSDSNFSTLPASGVTSGVSSFSNLTTNRTIRAKVQAKQQGLIVNGTKVLPATGVDTAECTLTVNFKDRLFYGRATTTNYDFTKLQSTELVTSRAKTIAGVTCSPTEYFFYAYPKSLGNLTSVIQDGALPIFGAFTKVEKTITNEVGISVVYNVYISNNKGAFTNSKLAFS